MLANQEFCPPLQIPLVQVALDVPRVQALACRCPACGEERVFDALAVTCRCADDDADGGDRPTAGMKVGRTS